MKIIAPNYTQTPNELFDEWLPRLGEIELKVLLLIMRKTFGWHKTREKISISYFSKLTGSCEKHVLKAIRSLIEKGLISKKVSGPIGMQVTYYELIVQDDSKNVYPWPKAGGTPGQKQGGTPGQKPGIKETIKKTKEKERSYKRDSEDRSLDAGGVNGVNGDKRCLHKEEDRSLDENSSIVSFDPETFRLPNGKPLSLRMKQAIAKYSNEDRQRLIANICYFQEQVKKGHPMNNPEAYLQNCIKYNYAQKETNAWQNRMYAIWAKEEYKLRKLEILKTVVRFKRSEFEPPESISFSLPPESFILALERYIENNKE